MKEQYYCYKFKYSVQIWINTVLIISRDVKISTILLVELYFSQNERMIREKLLVSNLF